MPNLNIQSINPDQLYNKLQYLVKADQPALIWGSPGCGKSRVIEQWAEAHGYGITTRMLSQIQPSDLSIPFIDQSAKVLRWAITDWLVDLPQDKPHILFFDELPSAPIDVRTAM